ncbi:hypothetical protein [Nostoc sp. UHCC 0251]|uniref:hypothetical protein n=1 Tax=Nostoc sp. UHCC 0251 TaxID=3110240 RepID=UPI002B1FD72B|nr:hypothetical protein [Nostoc sp. UHCC 0251]
MKVAPCYVGTDNTLTKMVSEAGQQSISVVDSEGRQTHRCIDVTHPNESKTYDY